ncbi:MULTISPECIES: formate dehydrogenase subunit gamma [Methylobacterium]|jgi:formate dehydrogenase subunit gamma|uniref:formate dehydrogenase subunit gamma n=1 Tax=Methylobacterium TaxID=407 RepID=UPI0008E9AA04|nr:MULTISPECIES: formate dehydrogenase subunit gamma [Methylobacterium]MBZ6413624.1 formate dehydrogenase subunit gamma [Methylobacterium sp.]MBK3397305.1 formate dehydrogenase subunit gamma [Methylobacterium ajmalii]MBK3412664.1 formate dehydrogenase subunit gamma [Methylobacterium ajmalii]MBK3423798.1 formate dehydrogenase subunit gamma [Methylobacterium ajmalii]SFF36453.1 formate dehydrogenase gamma subunit [Methylobacterium sp. yr596]
MPGYEPWDADRATGIIAEHAHREGATLPILHALQETFGYVDGAAVPLIAEALNLSRAEVHGCISFYHDFRSAPAGRHTVKLCRAEACQAMGADALHDDILRRYDVAWHGTTRDGQVTVEPVFCLGLCACGPAALVDGEPVGRLDLDALAGVLTERAA